MKNILIITVAGTSSRFSKSLGYNVLKCIYEEPGKKSILEMLLDHSNSFFDRIIIVGGYKFEELQKYLNHRFDKRTVSLLYNDHYEDYGSNYSLYVGIREALKEKDCKIVFAEGDLIVDTDSFKQVCQSDHSVITSTRELIRADRSVVFYQTIEGMIKYVYDTTHSALTIPEPFSLIANSGQIWKFTESNILEKIIQSQTIEDYKDTNLNIIQKYFQQLPFSHVSILELSKWYNCNTVEDYRKALKDILNKQ
jgi:choline kinase